MKLKLVFICNTKAALFGLVAVLLPAAAQAQEIHGYGELHFGYHDHGPDQTQPGGAPPDDRLVFDTTRFTVELEKDLAPDVTFEAEIEFEHGGTGAALELEYEEFGEYENEVEKGGEVLLEELYLEWEPVEHLELKAGRFYVAFGLLSALHRPTDYLGSARPESETRLVPAVWDEQGISAALELGALEVILQVVSGLDSTGFSSQTWIAGGHQRRFELVRATGLAGVARVDYRPMRGLLLGVSGYVGDTVPNRPKPDMQGTFAPLVLGDLHATYDRGPVRARAVAIWGYLDDSAAISEKNSRLSNNLEVLRTPVASQGLATWAELGVDIAPLLAVAPQHRVEPFVRLEHYDTMFDTAASIFDNPRFERTIAAIGCAYTYAGRVVATLDASHRRMGSSDFNRENTVQLGLGFLY